MGDNDSAVPTAATPVAIRPLAVGDKVPDVLLSRILNFPKRQGRLSDFTGKLLILDFWSSTCGTCIAGFPHVEQLQHEFGGQVQVLLVNTESEARVRQTGKRIKLPALPSVVGDSVLTALFPHKLAGYHVWIDKDGFVRLKGPFVNTHAAKIRQLLSGQPISFVHEDVEYDSRKPLMKLVGNSEQENIQTGSFFARGSDDLGQLLGGHAAKGIIDGLSNTYRNTFINRDVVQLYYEALEKKLDLVRVPNRIPVYAPWPDIRLDVQDTLQFTHRFIPSPALTDEQLKKSSFCYEQITPLNMSDEQRSDDMLNDLNRYFGRQYGLYGKIGKSTMTSYSLVYQPKDTKRLLPVSANTELAEKDTVVAGKRMRYYRNYKVSEVVAVLASRVDAGGQVVWLDDSGYNEPVELLVPHEQYVNTVEQLQEILGVFGLKIVIAKREVKLIVLSDKVDRDSKGK